MRCIYFPEATEIRLMCMAQYGLLRDEMHVFSRILTPEAGRICPLMFSSSLSNNQLHLKSSHCARYDFSKGYMTMLLRTDPTYTGNNTGM